MKRSLVSAATIPRTDIAYVSITSNVIHHGPSVRSVQNTISKLPSKLIANRITRRHYSSFEHF